MMFPKAALACGAAKSLTVQGSGTEFAVVAREASNGGMAFHRSSARPANAEFPQNAIQFLGTLPEKTRIVQFLDRSYFAQHSLYWVRNHPRPAIQI